ncbi:ABC transporter substrate-binding protein [Nocardia sp. alder85J]|uniref:ABC transporter substrate-binding protein n=1 Tax=Nocardia sp. alder85J TaxID=2862949 RepID=UPI001CD22E9D|nr:ABC transporter substrate-binding protein [Nocardia sp. alder85J]MCX4095046.1 ABC transporter substrate-binding protein [Nocardia sp. alder85J]
MFVRSGVRGYTLRAACVLAGGVLMLTGCSKNSETGSSPQTTTKVSETKVDDIAAKLPDKIKQAGKLTVGVNLPYAPNEFKDSSGKIVGFDIDLMDAVAGVLGVKADYQESEFERIIPAIEAGTLDVGMSSFTDNAEREKTVDFTDYFSAGSQWAQQKGKAVDPNNACGKKVAVEHATVQETDELPAKSKACKDAGKPEVTVVPYDDQAGAATALVLGQVDAFSADSPVTEYAVKQNPDKLELSGAIFDSAPYGWPVAKNSPLAAALQAATQHLIDSGDYRKIAENWGVQAGVVAKSVINGAKG